MRFTDQQKREIHAETAALYEKWYGPEHGAHGSCLYWSFTLGAVLLKRRVEFILQAGSLEWPMAPDRGRNMTHFSYIYEPWTAESMAAVAAGKMPEMHVWLARRDEGEIIDFAVRWLPEQAAGFGFKWELPRPPEFLWTDSLPRGVRYTPKAEAIKLIIEMRMREIEIDV